MTIKYFHRIPVAEKFLVPIGKAICVCQYLDGGLRDIGRKFQSSFYIKTIDDSSGTLVKNLKKLLQSENEIDEFLLEELLDLCEAAESIFGSRNEIVHSHGYTTLEGKQSRMHRSEKRQKIKYLETENINAFIQDAADIAVKANTLLHDDRMPKH